jgi:hypothetical protein
MSDSTTEGNLVAKRPSARNHHCQSHLGSPHVSTTLRDTSNSDEHQQRTNGVALPFDGTQMPPRLTIQRQSSLLALVELCAFSP